MNTNTKGEGLKDKDLEGTSVKGSAFFIDGKRVVASLVYNPDNENECLLVMPKDYVDGWEYKDYIDGGRNLSNRY